MGDTSRCTVAIIDDDAAVRDSMVLLLQVAGHAVESFASAAEFLHANRRQFACVIVDQHMPEMTGLDLVARLRLDGETMPILLLTGAPSPAIVARAKAIGVARVLEKPANDDALLDFVTWAMN